MNTVNCECEHGKCYANESQSTTRKRAWERLRENIFFYFSFRLVLLLLLSAFFFLHNSVYIFMCYVYMLSIDNMCWLVLIMKLVAFRMRFALFQYLLIVLSWLIVYLRGRWEGEPACGLFECEREQSWYVCSVLCALCYNAIYAYTIHMCVCVWVQCDCEPWHFACMSAARFVEHVYCFSFSFSAASFDLTSLLSRTNEWMSQR